MSVHLLSIALLIAIFIIATLRPVNMGALAFITAFGVGTFVTGESADEVVAGFPADLFVVLVGVTYLFAITKSNGTVEWLLDATVRLVGGRSAAIPWAFFLLAAAICAIGAVGPAVVAILMPVAMSFAVAYGIRPLMIGVMISMGTTAGSFSPIGIFGIIVIGVVNRNDIAGDGGLLFAATIAAGTLMGVATFLVLGGLSLSWRGSDVTTAATPGARTGPGPGTATAPARTRVELGAEQRLTLLGFAALVVGAIGFDLDVGFLALAVAVLLTLLFPASSRTAVNDISWGVVLLISGVVTYVGVLERNGTIDWLGDTVATVGSAVVAGLLICVIGAVVSAFASTTGILGALIPLAVPLITTGDVGAVGLVVALSISSSLVDTSPFSTNGAITLANAPEAEREGVYRGLLAFGVAMMVIGPVLSWSVLVAPGWL